MAGGAPGISGHDLHPAQPRPDSPRRDGGLRLVGADFWSIGLPKYVFLEVLDILFNPKKTIGRVVRLRKDKEEKPSIGGAPIASEVREQPKGT